MRLCGRDLRWLAQSALLLASLAGSGCAALQPPPHGLPSQGEASNQPLVIQPGQVLFVNLVQDEAKLSERAESSTLTRVSGKYTVQRNGAIEMGPFGYAHVAGLTPAQAEMAIAALLTEHLVEPKVSLEVIPSPGKGRWAHNDRSAEKQRAVRPKETKDANNPGPTHPVEAPALASRSRTAPPAPPRDHRPGVSREVEEERIDSGLPAVAGANAPVSEIALAQERPERAAVRKVAQLDSSRVPELIRVAPRTALMPPRPWSSQDDEGPDASRVLAAQVVEPTPRPRQPIAIARSTSRLAQPSEAPVRLLLGEMEAKAAAPPLTDVVVIDPASAGTDPPVDEFAPSPPDSPPGPKSKVVYRRVASSRPAADSRPVDPFQPGVKDAPVAVDPFQPRPVNTQVVDPFRPQPSPARSNAAPGSPNPPSRSLQPFGLPGQDAPPAPEKKPRSGLFSRPSQ